MNPRQKSRHLRAAVTSPKPDEGILPLQSPTKNSTPQPSGETTAWSAEQLPFIVVATVLMTLQPLLVKFSQVDGKAEYSFISTTLLSESTKIAISITMYARSAESLPVANLTEMMSYAVPALVYFINNNLVFVILEYIDSTSFQILSSMKTIFTAILFRVFLGRKLNQIQWIAVILLSCGTATSQLPNCATYNKQQHTNSSLVGLMLAMVTCVLSAFGGIYSEKLLKAKFQQSIHWQNMQLYTWGIMFNFVGTFLKDSSSIMEGGFFYGYNFFTWLVVLNNAVNGLAISAILKYADNIARVYAHAAAMLTTMVLSIFLFGAAPTPQLFLSIATVSCSTYLYNQKLEDVLALGKSSSSKYSSKSSSDSCGTPSKSPGKSSAISGSTKSYTKRLTFVTLAVTVLLAAGASLHFLTLDGQHSLISVSNGAHPKVYPGDHVKEHSEPNEGPRGGKDAKGGHGDEHGNEQAHGGGEPHGKDAAVGTKHGENAHGAEANGEEAHDEEEHDEEEHDEHSSEI